MPLSEPQAGWISAFTANAVTFPPEQGKTPDKTKVMRDDLRARQAKEAVQEQALKEAMLADVFKALDARKEEMQKAFDLVAKVKNDKGKVKQEKFLDERGQAKSFEADNAPKLESVPEGLKGQTTEGPKKFKPNEGSTDQLPEAPKEDIQNKGEFNATTALAFIVEQKDTLAKKKVERSVLDLKTGVIVSETQLLFTDDEIEKEVYTPLVRDMVIPDTLIDDRYSKTQKMIDGSNEYYVNECKEKGKRPTSGILTLAKGAVALGATIAGTIVTGLGPVKDGMDNTAASGTLTKEQAARATAITTGIAAVLTAGIDAVDQIDTARKSGKFSPAGYKTVMNGIGTGIGKFVAVATGNVNLGLAVTDGIAGGVAATSMIPTLVNWKLEGGKPPVAELIDAIGETIAKSFNTKSDTTEDSGTSTKWAQAGAGVGAAFKIAAKASEKKLLSSIQKGDWKEVFDVLLASGKAAAGAVPTMVQFAAQYNAIDGSDPKNPNQTEEEKKEKQAQDQEKFLKQMDILAEKTDAFFDGAEKILDKTGEDLIKAVHLEGVTPDMSKEMMQKMAKRLAEEQAKREAEMEVQSIQEELEQEKANYRASLNCLGSANPDDAEYKSIAKLIAQIEHDRAIWDGLFAMFGAGLAGASSVGVAMSVATQMAPGLKIAGQLVAYVKNLKAAADRLDAFLDWREARKDAVSAVSPYATSIQNFISNQGAQFTHYTIQATANAIQALLAAGELSPLGPAFTAAGGAVAATASAEDLVYQFMKQQALKKAWKETKEALDPKNKGNRRMALLVREINPTLAKYTIAYGALIERDPIAVTAMNRVGLDRETLTRAGDKVADVKNYLQTLYPDDNVVLGEIDAKPGDTKVPPPALTAKAWSLSYMLWTEKDRLITPNPPAIAANLVIIEPLRKKKAVDLDPDEQTQLMDSLRILEAAFKSFDPRTSSSAELEQAQRKAGVYADLAFAAIKTTSFELAQLGP